jgi:hypothetical protein
MSAFFSALEFSSIKKQHIKSQTKKQFELFDGNVFLIRGRSNFSSSQWRQIFYNPNPQTNFHKFIILTVEHFPLKH